MGTPQRITLDTPQPTTPGPYRELLRKMLDNDEGCGRPDCQLSYVGHLLFGLPAELVDLVRAEDPCQPNFPDVPDNGNASTPDVTERADHSNDPEALDGYDPNALNVIAGALTDLYGFVPLNVRYGAAAAALRRVNDYRGDVRPDERRDGAS